MRRFRATTFLAAVASLGAGGIHLATGGPHLQESVPLGAALVTVGWIQLTLGALVWGRPHRVTAIALTAVHVASIAAWSVSRSVGLPFGHPGGESFGVAGLTVVGLELIAIAALAVFVHDPARVRRLTAGVAFGALALVIGSASVAVANVGPGHEPAGDEATEDHDDGHEEGGDVHDGGGDGASHDRSATTSERSDGAADVELDRSSGPHSDDGHDTESHDDGHDGESHDDGH